MSRTLCIAIAITAVNMVCAGVNFCQVVYQAGFRAGRAASGGQIEGLGIQLNPGESIRIPTDLEFHDLRKRHDDGVGAGTMKGDSL